MRLNLAHNLCTRSHTLIWVGDSRTIVAHIAYTVAVAVQLVGIRDEWTIIAQIRYSIIICVFIARIAN